MAGNDNSGNGTPTQEIVPDIVQQARLLIDSGKFADAIALLNGVSVPGASDLVMEATGRLAQTTPTDSTTTIPGSSAAPVPETNANGTQVAPPPPAEPALPIPDQEETHEQALQNLRNAAADNVIARRGLMNVTPAELQGVDNQIRHDYVTATTDRIIERTEEIEGSTTVAQLGLSTSNPFAQFASLVGGSMVDYGSGNFVATGTLTPSATESRGPANDGTTLTMPA